MNTRILHTTAIFGSILLCLIMFGCDNNPGSGDTDLAVYYAFVPFGHINLTADTDHIRPSGEMVLTVRGTPRVTGTGQMVLVTSSQQPGGMVIIDSPVHDTIRNPIPSADTVPKKIIIPFSLVANQEFVVPWKLRMTNIQYHRFLASTIIDSIFIPDSGRLYPSQSAIIKKYVKIPSYRVFDTDANTAELEIRPQGM